MIPTKHKKDNVKCEEAPVNITKELSKIRQQISETRKEIQVAVVPKFLEVSTEAKDLIEHAVEIWRLEQKINKILSILPENQKETFVNILKKLKRYLEKNDIEILDYTNQKFNDGRNLEILSVEKNPKISESTIKETKEPTIMCKGQVVRRGKVIISAKDDKLSAGEK